MSAVNGAARGGGGEGAGPVPLGLETGSSSSSGTPPGPNVMPFGNDEDDFAGGGPPNGNSVPFAGYADANGIVWIYEPDSIRGDGTCLMRAVAATAGNDQMEQVPAHAPQPGSRAPHSPGGAQNIAPPPAAARRY